MAGLGVVLLLLAVTEIGGPVGILIPLWLVPAIVGLAMPNAPIPSL